MPDQQIVRTGGSRAVQGCLIGAVLLFVLLLVAMIVLGYQQFRENTGDPVTSTPPVNILVRGVADVGTGGRVFSPSSAWSAYVGDG